MRDGYRKNPGRFRAIVYAIVVHLVVIAMLVIGFRWTSDEPIAPAPTVQAVAVKDPEKQRQVEAEKQRQTELKKAEEERRRLDEQQRKQEAEKKRQAELKQREEQDRKKVEAEKKRKETEERRRSAEESLKQQLVQEERARQETARAARAATEAEKYTALIKQKVSRNWSLPTGSKTGLKCIVRVRLVPGGEVLAATVTQSSGDTVFDRSVENAVYKAAPLPLPSDPELFSYFRELEFLFDPEKIAR